jgi:hypothetical protein
MTFPKKGTRTITVDGVAYRWRLQPRCDCPAGFCTCDESFENADVVVEHGNPSGAVAILHFTFPPPEPTYARNLVAPQLPVTPVMIAEGIRGAVAAGWVAGQPDKQFELAVEWTPTEEQVRVRERHAQGWSFLVKQIRTASPGAADA